jgi:hypothetical protein
MGKLRLLNVVNEIKAEGEDVKGFRVLKLETSNMKGVYYRPDELKQSDLLDMVDNVKEGRTAEDLLFQVLVDWGVDLTLPIRRETVQGKTVFFVDDNALVACFDRGVTEDLVKELAEDLFDVDLHRVRDEAVVAEDHAQGLVACQLLHQILGDTAVEAGNKRIVVDEEHRVALQRLAADGQRQVHTPIDQHLEQQVLGRAAFLHVVDHVEQIGLLQLVGAAVDVLHVRGVHLEHSEADIAVPTVVGVCLQN